MTVLPTILNRHIRPKRSNGIAMDQFWYLDRGVKRRGGIGTGGGFQGRQISSGVIPADECQLLEVDQKTFARSEYFAV